MKYPTDANVRVAEGPSVVEAMQDEGALVRKAMVGDSRAFALLVRAYQRPVMALCRRYLSPSDAEDAAQETFVRAFVHVGRFDATKPLAPWLFTIARRLCLDRLRQTARTTDTPEAPEPRDTHAMPDDVIASRQALVRLSKALQELPEGPREALALYHFEHLSYRDIAEVLAVPVGTVMTWLHRGRNELRRALETPSNANDAMKDTP